MLMPSSTMDMAIPTDIAMATMDSMAMDMDTMDIRMFPTTGARGLLMLMLKPLLLLCLLLMPMPMLMPSSSMDIAAPIIMDIAMDTAMDITMAIMDIPMLPMATTDTIKCLLELRI